MRPENQFEEGEKALEQLTIGIDIGGTNFRIGTVDAAGNVEDFESHSSAMFRKEDAAEVLAHVILGYMERYALRGRIRGVGVGVPAVVSRDKHLVRSAPNLPGFDSLALPALLENQLSLPVFLDRDVNLLLRSDMHTLLLEPDKTVLGFYVGTGFGNAIYLDGGFYAGKNGAAGELGHIPMLDLTETCPCGNIGCCEVRCSGKHLEWIAKRMFPLTPVRQVFARHHGHPALERYVRDLAVPIAAEINILDPDCAVLSGGVLGMPGFPRAILLEAIHAHVRKPYPAEGLDLRFAAQSPQNGVRGGGMLAAEQLNKAAPRTARPVQAASGKRESL